jgi:phage shock protein A/DNA-binding XRE family transcriptional regulator
LKGSGVTIMSYRLRLHGQIRAWLTDLRDTEPEQARHVGEALLALIDAGEALGPSLVVSLESVLGQPRDPRESLDFSYQQQLEMLTRVRRGVADVATSRKRLELQMNSLEQQAGNLARQRDEAERAGREDLAGVARREAAAIAEQLSDLRQQYGGLHREEQMLTTASQRLQRKVEAFRTRKETLKAAYTAAEASERVREAMADLGEDAGDPELFPGDRFSLTTRRVTPQKDELLQEIRDEELDSQDGAEPKDHEDVEPPPGMMELRPGAPGELGAGLLFVVEPADTAVVLARVDDPGGSTRSYRAAIQLAAGRLPAATEGAGGADVPADDAFTSYDAESFLDEFFPGAETEVEIAAGALVARSRAHSLAEARQRMRLTQAQVARRMNVRQERVSAIERAEPGATEVRTLAAYVAALGGRLEIVAHIADDHITLR